MHKTFFCAFYEQLCANSRVLAPFLDVLSKIGVFLWKVRGSKTCSHFPYTQNSENTKSYIYIKVLLIIIKTHSSPKITHFICACMSKLQTRSKQKRKQQRNLEEF